MVALLVVVQSPVHELSLLATRCSVGRVLRQTCCALGAACVCHCCRHTCAVSWLLLSEECWAPCPVCRVHQGRVHGAFGVACCSGHGVWRGQEAKASAAVLLDKCVLQSEPCACSEWLVMFDGDLGVGGSWGLERLSRFMQPCM